MSASRPAPPEGHASWLDYVLNPSLVTVQRRAEHARAELAELRHRCISKDAQLAETHRQLDQATSELAELRKELADTKALLQQQAKMTLEAMAQRDAAQAERDEALSALQTKDGLLLAARNSSDTWQSEAAKWRRIRTPNHGPCCTCQGCGLDYDDCKCSEEERDDELRQAVQERDSLRAQVAELRGAVLDLGELVGVWDDARMDYVEVQVDKPVLSAWNALVARLRAEAPAQGKEEQ